jgi:hypothetical protein
VPPRGSTTRRLEAIRPIRGDIDQRVRQLLAALVGARDWLMIT